MNSRFRNVWINLLVSPFVLVLAAAPVAAATLKVSSFPSGAQVLVDGQLLGHWRLTRSRQSASIETRLQRSLSAKERPALERALARVRRFFEVDG